MSVFFKKNNDTPTIIQWIGHKTAPCLRRWAAWLQTKTACYSQRKKLSILCLVLLVLAAQSSWLICHSTASSSELSAAIGPPHTGIYLAPRRPIISRIDQQQYKRIMAYKQYLDSLRHSPDSARWYAHILRNRPGLRDSLLLLEKLYLEQNSQQP